MPDVEIREERRVVTALFADLVGSTRSGTGVARALRD
jgi:class 3 adenylate cyclase